MVRKMLDRLTKWLNVGQVTDALKHKQRRVEIHRS